MKAKCSEKCDGQFPDNIVLFIFFFASQNQFVSWARLLPSARVGGRHNGQNSDEDVDRVHIYSNRPGEEHNVFPVIFWS